MKTFLRSCILLSCCLFVTLFASAQGTVNFTGTSYSDNSFIGTNGVFTAGSKQFKFNFNNANATGNANNNGPNFMVSTDATGSCCDRALCVFSNRSNTSDKLTITNNDGTSSFRLTSFRFSHVARGGNYTVNGFDNNGMTGSIVIPASSASMDLFTMPVAFLNVTRVEITSDIAAGMFCAFDDVILAEPATPPAITSVSFNASSNVVTLLGTGFNATAADNIVFFGAVKAIPSTASTTSLTVTVPTGATYDYITVLNTETSVMASSAKPFSPAFTPLNSALTFAPKVDISSGSGAAMAAIGDLDGDGKPDLAVVNSGNASLSLFRNISSSGSISAASFAPAVNFATGTTPYSIAISDLDLDGKLDLIVANYGGANALSIFHNVATPGSITSSSLETRIDLPIGTFGFGPSVGDLDGDGKPEIVVSTIQSANVVVLRNISTPGTLSSSSFAAGQAFTTGTGTSPNQTAIGDLDGDGKPDIAVANYDGNTVSVFRNTSTTGSIISSSFAAKVDFVTGSQPQGLAISDIDGDGKADLITANIIANSISVLRNVATIGNITTSSFEAHVDFSTGTGASTQMLAVGDLDGDGKPDIAAANTNNATVSLFRNTATIGSITTSSFAAAVNRTIGSGAFGVSIGDLDGDSRPDLAVACMNSNAVSILHAAYAPSDIGLSAISVNENVTANATVGTLSATDVEGGTMIYSLVSGTGSTDNVAFNISGTSLRITGSPDYETKNSYGIRIRVIDPDGFTYEKEFTITVNDLNEAPTLSGTYTFASIPTSQTSAGVTVTGLLTASNISYTDQDAGAQKGIALTGVTGNGVWQYSTDGGANWNNVQNISSTLSITNALLLGATASVSYVATSTTETATISFKAWDQTAGTASSGATRQMTNTTLVNSTFSTGVAIGSITIIDNTAPAIPAGLAATPGNQQNVLTWTANTESDFASYKIYGGTSASPNTLLTTATGTTFTHTGLSNGTTYYYRIAAMDNNSNESAKTADVSAIPVSAQTITFNTLSNVTYGVADIDPGASASSGLTVGYQSSNTAVATIVSGKIHVVGAGNTTITALQAGNAVYLAATDQTQGLTVDPKTINVTADPKSKTFGDAEPAFTYTFTPALITGDAFSGTLSRTAGENAGTYAIQQGSLSLSANYTLVYTPANFTILPSTNASLSSLTVSTGTLTPSFHSDSISYIVPITQDIIAESLIPTAAETVSTIKVNGNTVSNGSATTITTTGDITIAVVEITAGDGIIRKTYTFKFIKPITTWTGTVSNAWTDAGNWTNGVPDLTRFAIIADVLPRPVVSSNQSVMHITVNSGAAITLSGNLQVAGNLVNNGTFSGTGNLVFNGNTAQTISGNGTAANITNNNNNGISITAGTGNKLNVTGIITMNAGTLATGNNLVLRSTASGTASVAPLAAGASITGLATMERWMDAQRGYRTFAHPFNSALSLSQLTDDFSISGNGAGFVTGLGYSTASVSYYDSLATQAVSFKKPLSNAPNTASTPLWSVGRGILALVRGKGTEGLGGTYPDISQPSAFAANATGVLNQGDLEYKLGANATGTSFNLVGNPYAAPINIRLLKSNGGILLSNNNAASGVANTIYIYNPYKNAGISTTPSQEVRGGMDAYTNDGTTDIIIPAFGAFFVQPKATGNSILFNENVKAAGVTPIAVMGGGTTTKLTLSVENSKGTWDDIKIRWDKTAAATGTDPYDGLKMNNELLDAYSISSDSRKLCIDSRSDSLIREEIIPLGIATAVEDRTFRFRVSAYSMPSNIRVVLRDKLLMTETLLAAVNDSYSFAITADSSSKGDNRFELAINLKKETGTPVEDVSAEVKVMPNPFRENLVIQLGANARSAKTTHVRLVNMNGRVVRTLDAAPDAAVIRMQTADLAAGVYFVEVINDVTRVAKQVIKQ